jgi:hypothetical protein
LRTDGKGGSAVTKDRLERDYTTGSVALDKLLELEEAYLSMASLLGESDGVDCTDPDEVCLCMRCFRDHGFVVV